MDVGGDIFWIVFAESPLAATSRQVGSWAGGRDGMCPLRRWHYNGYGLSTTCRGLGGNGEKQRPGSGPPFGFKEAWAWIRPCLHLLGGKHSLLGPGLGGIRWGFLWQIWRWPGAECACGSVRSKVRPSEAMAGAQET